MMSKMKQYKFSNLIKLRLNCSWKIFLWMTSSVALQMEISNKFFLHSNLIIDLYIYEIKNACSILHCMYSEFNFPPKVWIVLKWPSPYRLIILHQCLCFRTLPQTRGRLLGNSWSLRWWSGSIHETFHVHPVGKNITVFFNAYASAY